MINHNNIVKILLRRRYYQIHFTKSCSISIITRKPTVCRLSEPSIQSFTLFNKSVNSINSTILFERGLKGGSGYSNIVPPNYKQPPKRYSKYFIAAQILCVFALLLFRVEEIYDPETDTKAYKFFIRGLNAATVDDNKIEENKNEKKKKSKKNKAEVAENSETSEVESEEKDESLKKKKKKHVSFKDRKIIEYENRLREYSTPDKIFRYFATLKIWNQEANDYEVFMRPEDFVRSLTFGDKQNQDLGLDSYQRFEPNMYNLDIHVSEDSVFKHFGNQGLISFSDYLFLLTLLSIPTKHFEISFKMWDLDGSGHIDIKEFEELQVIIRNNTNVGSKHRDTRMTGSVIKENSSLNKYFFGSDFKELLTVEKFIEFQKQLQSEMIRLEFDRFEPTDGKINDYEFCEALLGYAGFSDTKKKRMLKRVNKAFKENIVRIEGITLKDYEDFFNVLRSIQDIDTALKFYALAGASIDQTVFKHVAKTVSGVVLNDHLVEVVFILFDVNGDGKLSHREFINVMKKRWLRGLQNPKDTGFVKFMNAFYSCAKETALARAGF